LKLPLRLVNIIKERVQQVPGAPQKQTAPPQQQAVEEIKKEEDVAMEGSDDIINEGLNILSDLH